MATASVSARGNGVCMMNNAWRDEQHPSFIGFISSFLKANSYRLSFIPIAPDFIFNNGGVSVAFVFVTNWDPEKVSAVFTRIGKLKKQFGHLYVVVSVPTREQNDSFNRSYFKYVLQPNAFHVHYGVSIHDVILHDVLLSYGMELGCPTFVPVRDPEMGFEKIVKIAHTHGVCKQEDVINRLKVERERQVQAMDMFLRVVTSVPCIDEHDANALIQTVGSIQAISKASNTSIVENTDLSADKADRIARFFRDPQYYLSPKLN